MEYDKEKYKVWKLPHPLLLHWIINPGLAINELILGQRLPKVMLIDKTSDAPLMERKYAPCPECNAINDGRLWSKGNTFGHWFGLVCPKCGGRIPCLWNITSLALLAITFPLWIWIKIYGEKRWIEIEKTRFIGLQSNNLLSQSNELPKASTTSWVKMGAMFGGLMFCIMSLPQIFKNKMSSVDIIIQIAIWAGAGLFFGLMMKFFLGRRKKS